MYYNKYLKYKYKYLYQKGGEKHIISIDPTNEEEKNHFMTRFNLENIKKEFKKIKTEIEKIVCTESALNVDDYDELADAMGITDTESTKPVMVGGNIMCTDRKKLLEDIDFLIKYIEGVELSTITNVLSELNIVQTKIFDESKFYYLNAHPLELINMNKIFLKIKFLIHILNIHYIYTSNGTIKIEYSMDKEEYANRFKEILAEKKTLETVFEV